jgi:uncharacterized protein
MPRNALCVMGSHYRLISILLLVAGVCAADAVRHRAQADELQSGIAAYERGDYAKALKVLGPLAERGDKYAQSHLGAMYLHGLGVEKDFAKALTWNRKAAEAGLAGSQHMLGQMYWTGTGVPKDYDEAAKWYQRAADQGEAEGQAALAYMYLHGQSVPRDPEKAVSLYHKAANQGMALAQYQMGMMYYEGAVVANDPVQAHLWLTLALTGLKPGVFRDDAQAVLKDLAKRMSDDQVSEAERLEDAWRPTKE